MAGTALWRSVKTITLFRIRVAITLKLQLLDPRPQRVALRKRVAQLRGSEGGVPSGKLGLGGGSSLLKRKERIVHHYGCVVAIGPKGYWNGLNVTHFEHRFFEVCLAYVWYLF